MFNNNNNNTIATVKKFNLYEFKLEIKGYESVLVGANYPYTLTNLMSFLERTE